MQKKITKVEERMHGHRQLTFEDGSVLVIERDVHKAHEPKVGDLWPPAEKQGEAAAAASE